MTPKKIKGKRRAIWPLWGLSGEEEKCTEFWCGDTKRKSNTYDIGEDECVILRKAWT
jgi:hypothetical protein